MTLFTLLLVIIVFVVVLWMLERYVVPMLPNPIGRVILVAIVIIMILWLLSVAGILPNMGTRLT